MKKLITIILVIFIFTQCKKEETKTIHSYISAYREVKDVSFDIWPLDEIKPMVVDSITFAEQSSGKYYPKYLYRNTFNQYAKLYNDINFSTNSSDPIMLSRPEVYLDTISNITFITLNNYDKNHKAGSEINDIVNIRYNTVKDFLESGYTDVNSLKNRNESLETFNKEQHYLVQINYYLTLQTPPDTTGKYTFATIYKKKNGTIYRAKTRSVYIKGKE